MKSLLALPAILLAAGCGTAQPVTFSDGYVTARFVTNPANHAHGTVVEPGTYQAIDPTGRCAWDAQDLRTGERTNGSGGAVTLGGEYWMESTGCGAWKEMEEGE